MAQSRNFAKSVGRTVAQRERTDQEAAALAAEISKTLLAPIGYRAVKIVTKKSKRSAA